MIFDDVRMPHKKEILKEYKKEILLKVEKGLFNFHELSDLAIDNYLNILLNESEYDKKRGCFFEVFSNVEITIDMFASMTIEYITEHIDEFLIEK